MSEDRTAYIAAAQQQPPPGEAVYTTFGQLPIGAHFVFGHRVPDGHFVKRASDHTAPFVEVTQIVGGERSDVPAMPDDALTARLRGVVAELRAKAVRLREIPMYGDSASMGGACYETAADLIEAALVPPAPETDAPPA